jgi:hypothetical protein
LNCLNPLPMVALSADINQQFNPFLGFFHCSTFVRCVHD